CTSNDLASSDTNGWARVTVDPNRYGYDPVHESHTGKWAVRIHNKTPRAPNVYGMMENSAGVTLKEKTQYTLSLWAKCESTGDMTLTVNGAWTERLSVLPTAGQWKRFSKTFTPAPGDLGFTPRILVETPTE